MKRPRSLPDVLALWAQLPPDTMLSAAAVVATLAPLVDAEPEAAAPPVTVNATPTWATLLWIVPSETRLGRAEACEALGRSESWLYKHTAAKGQQDASTRLPCRRLDGELTFLAGELRAWLRAHEETIAGGESEPAPWERSHVLRLAS